MSAVHGKLCVKLLSYIPNLGVGSGQLPPVIIPSTTEHAVGNENIYDKVG